MYGKSCFILRRVSISPLSDANLGISVNVKRKKKIRRQFSITTGNNSATVCMFQTKENVQNVRRKNKT